MIHKVVFLGSSEFAVTCLKTISKLSQLEIVGIITQPDRPAGRKLKLQPTPVNVCCQHPDLAIGGIPIICPPNVNAPEVLQQIKEWQADAAIVVAFGQILKKELLKLFPKGAVNVHASLLPRWRGAAPIQRAIEAGDEYTGVSLQIVALKLDTGPVIATRKLKIAADMDSLVLHERLAELGAEILAHEYIDFLAGKVIPTGQDDAQATYAKKIAKEEGRIDWQLSAVMIANKVRAFQLGPGCWTTFKEKMVKIHQCTPITAAISKFKPGTISALGDDYIMVATGSGELKISCLQLAGKPRCQVQEFLRGYKINVGDSFDYTTY